MGKILFADGDHAVLTKSALALSEDFHTVITCKNGLEAINKFRNDKFDLIVMDLNLEKMNGQKVIDLLQVEQSGLPCPIIVSTTSIDEQVITGFANNAKIHFLPKPVEMQTLKSKVQQVLANPTSRSNIDVRFVNPVLNATMDVISRMTNYQITAGKPYIKRPFERSGDISGVVGVVSSGFKGTISLSFNETTFLIVVSKLLGEPYTKIDEDNKDAVAELLNIIFGAAKKVLNDAGMNIQPAIPTIIWGKDHSLSHHSQNNTIVIPFQNPELGEFRSELSSLG